MDCIFCKIIKKEIPSYVIYEDKYCIVFLDINPKVDGHMLLAPKEHFLDIKDIDTNILTHLNNTSIKMIKLLEEKMDIDGVTIIHNNGCAQEIKHFHMHIVPRYKDDGVTHIYCKDNINELESVKNKLIN